MANDRNEYTDRVGEASGFWRQEKIPQPTHKVVSRNVGIVLLVLSGVSVGIGFLCFLGFIGLESEYSSSCQGFTGALVQSDNDGQQACEDLGGAVFLVGLFAAIFGIFGLLGILIGFILISSNPRPQIISYVSHPNQATQGQNSIIRQKEYVNYQPDYQMHASQAPNQVNPQQHYSQVASGPTGPPPPTGPTDPPPGQF